MQPEQEALAAGLAAAREAFDTGAASLVEPGLELARIRGGANNALYRVTTGGRAITYKLCVVDARQRALREARSLALLEAAGKDIAPRLLAYEEAPSGRPYQWVAYEWLAGENLQAPLSPAALAAMLGSLHEQHSVLRADYPQAGLPQAWFHWFCLPTYLDELDELLGEYGGWLARSLAHGEQLRRRLEALARRCRAACQAAQPVAWDQIPACLCHVDPNLANTVVGEDGRLRWVDWEYAGWGDPALDLAELNWHASLEGLSVEQKRWLRQSYRAAGPDGSFWERVTVYDAILAARWPLLVLRWLWSQEQGPDRLRFGRLEAPVEAMQQRLEAFVSRAESYYDGSTPPVEQG